MTTTTTTTPEPQALGLFSQTSQCLDGRTQLVCGPACEWIFDRINVYPKVGGGTAVQWALHPEFAGTPPFNFHLQVGRTGNPLADDWEWIAGPVVDTYSITDNLQRVYGEFPWTHYRVVVTTSDDPPLSYASRPQSTLGVLGALDWNRYREVLRGEQLRLQRAAGIEGYLLKRRLFGEPCECQDQMTEESRDPRCDTCYGTGYVGGYFEPYPCFFLEFIQPSGNRSSQTAVGTKDSGFLERARLINDPQVFSYDVWVRKDNDDRYIIHELMPVTRLRGVDAVLTAGLRRAPYSHIIYRFPVP